MSVKHLDWDFSKRGQEDVARHQKKLKESIRKNLTDIIAEESIITRKKGQTVKVPIRGIKSYRFVHGRRKGAGGSGKTGFGHGGQKKGDVIGRRFVPGQKPGNAPGKGNKPGQTIGDDYLEAEIDIEELINMMMEDLQLPDLRRKEVAETVIPKGWTFDNIEKHGLKPNLDKKRTIKEAIKRGAKWARDLAHATGRPIEECTKALNQANGSYERALEILKGKASTPQNDEVSSKLKPHIFNEDLRYRTIKEDVDFQSNAVILAMMDVSGSMTTTKKYLARSFFFWMVEFLKHKYRKVEIRFISHTTVAKFVDEHEFFHKGESGGTLCASAYELAEHIIETDYPLNKWNVYGFHFSDGEDWDSAKTMNAVKRLLDKDINMLGYGEIHSEPAFGQQLMANFEKELQLVKKGYSNDFEYFTPRGEKPFIGVIIKNKENIYPALKAFFARDALLK